MFQEAVAVEVTVAQAVRDRVFTAVMDAIAGCFARHETRAVAETNAGLLGGGHPELLDPGPGAGASRSAPAAAPVVEPRFDRDRARGEIARLLVQEPASQNVVLVADEIGNAKSSTDCVGDGRQCSGALKDVSLCQVAVHLAAVTQTARVVIDRALCLPKDWAADEEPREAVGILEEIMFATTPGRHHGCGTAVRSVRAR
ncbi:transposase [Streptomyces sp. S1A]|uniref:transposase n=1 Tax=Streptomyces sp. ICN903 TaxID=2964654 RepID=UPI001EDA548F|nr:transposase [Streptomyces sp. ICN903]MCG3039598.1 transposase [Streptomyces sp. ICN903]